MNFTECIHHKQGLTKVPLYKHLICADIHAQLLLTQSQLCLFPRKYVQCCYNVHILIQCGTISYNATCQSSGL